MQFVLRADVTLDASAIHSGRQRADAQDGCAFHGWGRFRTFPGLSRPCPTCCRLACPGSHDPDCSTAGCRTRAGHRAFPLASDHSLRSMRIRGPERFALETRRGHSCRAFASARATASIRPDPGRQPSTRNDLTRLATEVTTRTSEGTTWKSGTPGTGAARPAPAFRREATGFKSYVRREYARAVRLGQEGRLPRVEVGRRPARAPPS